MTGPGLQLIEISHVIEPGMTTYPGLPEPRSEIFLSYEASRERYQDRSEFLIASLHLCGNTGTYVDAPIHRFREGADLASLPLSRLAHLPVEVCDARHLPDRGIGPSAFEGRQVEGKAVLLWTGWSERWRTPEYFLPNPYLSKEGADYLADRGAGFGGIDSINIDDMKDSSRPAHTRLLGAGIPVCEHLTHLDAVQSGRGWLHAVPIAWRGGASFPVRAYVVVRGEL